MQAAIDYLQQAGVGKNFNGGLIPEEKELPEFLLHYFWISRCNAAMPAIHFTDSKQRITATICKQGNLHIDPLNATTDKQLKKQLQLSAFTLINWNHCSNKYYKSNTIIGRRMMI